MRRLQSAVSYGINMKSFCFSSILLNLSNTHTGIQETFKMFDYNAEYMSLCTSLVKRPYLPCAAVRRSGEVWSRVKCRDMECERNKGCITPKTDWYNCLPASDGRFSKMDRYFEPIQIKKKKKRLIYKRTVHKRSIRKKSEFSGRFSKNDRSRTFRKNRYGK